MQHRELPGGWDDNLPVFAADPKGIAGREASGKVLNVLAQNIPWFLGGSADLGPSNKTTLKYDGAGDFQADNPSGKNCILGSANTQWRPVVNGISLSKSGLSAQLSSSSVITPGLLSGSPHLWNYQPSSFSLTTRWVTEKMARHINRGRASGFVTSYPRAA